MRVRIHPAVILAGSVLVCFLWLGVRALLSRNADRHQVTLDPRTLARYVGSYRVNEHLSIVVTEQGQGARAHLFAHANGLPTLQMLPKSEKEFFVREIDARVEFVLSARGAVVRMRVRVPRQEELFAQRVRN